MAWQDILLKKYFQEESFVESNIESFNNFVSKILPQILEENKEIIPTIVPPDVEEYKIRFDNIRIDKVEVTEADGSRRAIMPNEARLRKLTYASPMYVDISAHIDGVQRETFTAMIGNLPIMLKSKYCHLHGLSREEQIRLKEDPDDPGGYFIINGTEKVLVAIEDLAPNRFLVEKTTVGPSKYIGKIFSERGASKIPHVIEKMKDGIFYLSFTRVKRIPLVIVLKALGLVRDEDIMKAVSTEKQYDELIINLYEFVNIKKPEEAIDAIAKSIGLTMAKAMRIERATEIIDRYLLPNIGIEPRYRLLKAYNLCKYLKKFIEVANGNIPVDDKDHYMNKRLKLSGDLLADLLRANFRVLRGDIRYNFQRIVKRGKFPSIRVIVRDKLLTSRIFSAMATGNWSGGRKGVSQRIQRMNFLEMLSHLQRVVSPLSATQENFEARELHATHLGRLCPIETPEGTNIGLRKNLALLCKVSADADEEEVYEKLKELGMKPITEIIKK